eukprot:TRINITY_DN6397_c0_g6_i1.p1 TRINITY_DN6397_c0_g6~~TRINITY_DN6397_c0_g6_i1.p1  ORF type:complete len:248 (+),score=71.93 TRINITY_DN6397_c0_g6_i1:182-925(+)
MSDFAPNQERDTVFIELFHQPENKICFDCGAANPKWASIKNGIFICFQCSTKHRSFDVQTSFTRSCTLDRWKWKDLEQMKLGGNKAAKAYFDKNDLTLNGQHDYTSPLAAKYRTVLAKKAEEALKAMPVAFETEDTKAETVEGDSTQVAAAQQPVVVKKAVAAGVSGSVLSKYFLRNLRRKSQEKQTHIKARKLDIDFDNLGNDEEEPEVKVAAKPAIKPVAKMKPVEDDKSDKFRNMKGISSTDYM